MGQAHVLVAFPYRTRWTGATYLSKRRESVLVVALSEEQLTPLLQGVAFPTNHPCHDGETGVNYEREAEPRQTRTRERRVR